MDVIQALALLGGLSPARFMRRHWHKQPLLVRQAWPGVQPPLARAALFDLAGRDDVESRLVQRLPAAGGGETWRLRSGPLPRRALPPATRAGWTLLVQGLDLHVAAAQQMLQRFAFLPHARLDDLMLSWASDGGGVGPHLDSYDVFLLQLQGRRRWQVARVEDVAGATWQPQQPLKILAHFQPEQEWLLEPGDMLYLPPGWAHDGVAVGGDCMTCSVGFRAPAADALAAELLQRLADSSDDGDDGDDSDSTDCPADKAQTPASCGPRRNAAVPRGARLYRDAQQPATANPGAIPAALQGFARQAVARLLAQPHALDRALGEVLSEPKPQIWFEAGAARAPGRGVRLAAATRMVYDERHAYINGESFRASGRDARLMHRLADGRCLGAEDCARLSLPAQALVDDWQRSGWLIPDEPQP